MNMEITELTNEALVLSPAHSGLIDRVQEELTSLPYTVLSFKLNLNGYSNLQPVEDNFEEFPVSDVMQYLTHHGTTPKYATMGLHLDGNMKHPHIHFTVIAMITEKFRKQLDTNASGHRRRYYDKMKKDGYEVSTTFLNVSLKKTDQIDETKPAYECLAYPLKEGLHAYTEPALRKQRYFGVSPEFFQILLNLGTTIYEQRRALHLRQEKCEERKQNALEEIRVVAEEGRGRFSNLRELALYLDTAYIAKLEINKYPDPHNYKVNCQKVAVHMGIAKYSDWV